MRIVNNSFIVIFFFCLISCQKNIKPEESVEINKSKPDSIITRQIDKQDEVDYDSFYKLDSYLTTGKVDSSNLQIIDSTCAILVYPTDKQIEQLKKETGEEEFAVIADDYSFYQAAAIHILDSLHVKKVTAGKDYIQINGSKKRVLDIRKQNFPLWNLIFFVNGKDPIVVPAIDLDIEKAEEYFGIETD